MTKTKDKELLWAAAAAASDAAALLGLPATVAEGRPQIETVAAMLGIADPEDLEDEALEDAVEEVIDEVASEAAATFRYFREAAGVRKGSFGDIAPELWLALDGPGTDDPAVWEHDELRAVNPYLWTPELRPDAPLFDPRIELPLHEETRESVAAQGILVPVVVTVTDAGEIAVLDGIQRWRCALSINRERLALWARTKKPQPLIRAIPARVVRDGVFSAVGAFNEIRQQQDQITKARRIDQLIRHGGLDLDQAAASLGVRRRMATYYLSLLKLSAGLQRKVRCGSLPFNVARVVCQISDHELQAAAVKAIAGVPKGMAIAGLKTALADDALKERIADGVPITRPSEAGPGTITKCAATGVWFYVDEGAVRIETAEGPRYVSELPTDEDAEAGAGAREASVSALPVVARARAAIAAPKGGEERDHKVAAAVLAAIEGRRIPAEFRWLLGHPASAGRRSERRQEDLEEYLARSSEAPSDADDGDDDGVDWVVEDEGVAGDFKWVVRGRDGDDHRFEVYRAGNLQSAEDDFESDWQAAEAAKEWCARHRIIGGHHLALVNSHEPEGRFLFVRVTDASGDTVHETELCKKAEHAWKRAAEWCASGKPGVTVAKAGAELRAILDKTINTRTQEGRAEYDQAVLAAIAPEGSGDGRGVSAVEIRERAGGTALQARASIGRLINAGWVTWEGKGSGTRYTRIGRAG